ncbi:MAG: zinc ribbon domain-containing protein [Thermodesulfobacteriota bacterium]
MKEQIETLVKLQGIETDAARIQVLIDQLVRKAGNLETELNAAEQAIEQDTASLEELRKAYRSQESDVKMNSDTVKKNQERLLTVKTNKEYQALLKGIDEIKRRNSRIEDEMLALIDQIEAAEQALQQQNEAYERLKARIQTEKKSLQSESEQSRQRLVELGRERDRIAAGVPKDLMRKYETARNRDSGPAIVPVRGTVCEGCNMNIPPQMSNELRRFEDLKFCPFCNRIIYWESLE